MTTETTLLRGVQGWVQVWRGCVRGDERGRVQRPVPGGQEEWPGDRDFPYRWGGGGIGPVMK